MAFQQGLSGLESSSTQLDVIGNNIANSSTVGFKSSQAQFADIYANSLNSVAGNTAGIGVSTSNIAQSFTQGALTTSANPLDIAISGAGFFRTVANGQVQYTRNGQFQVDKSGFLTNAQGANITGYNAINGKIVAGPPVPIQIDAADMAPKATTLATITGNLTSTATMPTTVPFNAQDSTSYNNEQTTTVYDSLGNASTLNTYYVKTGEDTWDVYTGVNNQEVTSATVSAASQTDPASVADRAAYQTAVTTVPVDAANISAAAQQYAVDAGAAVLAAAVAAGASQSQQDAITASYASASAIATQAGQTPDQIDAAITASVNVPAVKTASLIFNTDGSLDTTAMLALVPPESMPISVTLPETPSTGATNPMTFNINLTGTTQFATSTSTNNAPQQDGYAGGSLTTFTTDDQGVIQGQYSNGQTRELGQVVLANFTDPNGLDPVGSNAWVETSASGQPLIGTPNSGTLGKLLSNTTESSNTDLTTELVNMITAQRAYQANAQTIKTEDQILQTLVNLR